MLITYKETLKNCEVHVGDECEVYFEGKFVWIRITKINEYGHIFAIAKDGEPFVFKTKQEFFNAIGDV